MIKKIKILEELTTKSDLLWTRLALVLLKTRESKMKYIQVYWIYLGKNSKNKRHKKIFQAYLLNLIWKITCMKVTILELYFQNAILKWKLYVICMQLHVYLILNYIKKQKFSQAKKKKLAKIVLDWIFCFPADRKWVLLESFFIIVAGLLFDLFISTLFGCKILNPDIFL